MKSGVNAYNKMTYESGPVKISDFLSDVQNKVHIQMFEDAMNKFYEEHPEFKNNKNIKIIEIKQKEYWMPSKIKIIDYSNKPLKYYEYSLKDFWNNTYVKKYDDGNIPENLGGNNNLLDYLDFIHGKATMLDRYNNDKYKVDFKYLGNNIELSNEFNVFPETFKYKYIFGNFN